MLLLPVATGVPHPPVLPGDTSRESNPDDWQELTRQITLLAARPLKVKIFPYFVGLEEIFSAIKTVCLVKRNIAM